MKKLILILTLAIAGTAQAAELADLTVEDTLELDAFMLTELIDEFGRCGAVTQVLAEVAQEETPAAARNLKNLANGWMGAAMMVEMFNGTGGKRYPERFNVHYQQMAGELEIAVATNNRDALELWFVNLNLGAESCKPYTRLNADLVEVFQVWLTSHND